MSFIVSYPKRRKLQEPSAIRKDPPPAEEPDQDSKPEAAAATAAIVSSSSEQETTTTTTTDNHASQQNDSSSCASTNTWRTRVLAHLPQCCAAEGIRETSTFVRHPPRGRSAGNPRSSHHHPTATATTVSCLKKLLHEYTSLEDSLPNEPAIWVRYDEETPQYGRALIAAPPGTPYGYGLFTFDVFIPNAYPSVPPQLKLLTTGNGTCRFSPNLYDDGTVCLSLLGTWSGPRWNPQHSTLLQVLVSIQGLILGVEHPYYLEPGHGGWEGQVPSSTPILGVTSALVLPPPATTATSAAASTLIPAPVVVPSVPRYVQQAEDQYRIGTVRFALLETCQAKALHFRAFATIIAAHFAYYRHDIMNQVQAWEEATLTQASRQGATLSPHSTTLKLREAIPKLRAVLEQLPSLDTILKMESSEEDGAGSAAAANGSANPAAPQEQRQRAAMEEAAARGDYITAGQLQSEWQQNTTVATEIAARTRDMEQAAARGDFIAAGQWQESDRYA